LNVRRQATPTLCRWTHDDRTCRFMTPVRPLPTLRYRPRRASLQPQTGSTACAHVTRRRFSAGRAHDPSTPIENRPCQRQNFVVPMERRRNATCVSVCVGSVICANLESQAFLFQQSDGIPDGHRLRLTHTHRSPLSHPREDVIAQHPATTHGPWLGRISGFGPALFSSSEPLSRDVRQGTRQSRRREPSISRRHYRHGSVVELRHTRRPFLLIVRKVGSSRWQVRPHRQLQQRSRAAQRPKAAASQDHVFHVERVATIKGRLGALPP